MQIMQMIMPLYQTIPSMPQYYHITQKKLPVNLNSTSIQKNGISILQSTFFRNHPTLTKRDIGIQLGKSWSPLNKLDLIQKCSSPANLERNYFQTTVESVLAYRARSWTVTKSLEKAIDYAYTRMLRAVMKISWE